jgi:hypothetical protein
MAKDLRDDVLDPGFPLTLTLSPGERRQVVGYSRSELAVREVCAAGCLNARLPVLAIGVEGSYG